MIDLFKRYFIKEHGDLNLADEHLDSNAMYAEESRSIPKLKTAPTINQTTPGVAPITLILRNNEPITTLTSPPPNETTSRPPVNMAPTIELPITRRGRFVRLGDPGYTVFWDVYGRIRSLATSLIVPDYGKGVDLYFDGDSNTGALIPIDWGASPILMYPLNLGGTSISLLTNAASDPNALASVLKITGDRAWEAIATS